MKKNQNGYHFFVNIFLVGLSNSNITAGAQALEDADAFRFIFNNPDIILWHDGTTVAEHSEAFSDAFENISTISGINATETTNFSQAVIRAYTSQNNTEDWAGLWSGNANNAEIWINQPNTTHFTPGNYGWIGHHEVGHALGLLHQEDHDVISVMRTEGSFSHFDYTVIDRSNLNWAY